MHYGEVRYPLPADVFNDSANWMPQITIPFVPIPNLQRYIGFFRYVTNRAGRGLYATGSYGLSIFGNWSRLGYYEKLLCFFIFYFCFCL